MNRNLFRILLAIALGVGSSILIAYLHQEPIGYTTLGEALLRQPDGSYRHAPLDGQTLAPGDVVHYLLVAKNSSSKPEDVISTVSIPLGTDYSGGSASAVRSIIEFTTDDGSTWSGDPVASGNGSKVTALRWKRQDPLPPGETAGLEYLLKVTGTYADRTPGLPTAPRWAKGGAGGAATEAAPEEALGLASFVTSDAPKVDPPVNASGVSYHTIGEALVHQRDGSYERRPLASTALSPGDLVRYLVIAANHSERQQTAAASMTVPPFTEYVNDGSNVGRAVVEFSSDGRTWYQDRSLPGGSKGSRIRAFRWVLIEPLEPHESALFAFMLRVVGPYQDRTGDIASLPAKAQQPAVMATLAPQVAQKVMTAPGSGPGIFVPVGSIELLNKSHRGGLNESLLLAMDRWKSTLEIKRRPSDQTPGLKPGTSVRYNPAHVTFDTKSLFIIVIAIGIFVLVAKLSSKGNQYFAAEAKLKDRDKMSSGKPLQASRGSDGTEPANLAEAARDTREASLQSRPASGRPGVTRAFRSGPGPAPPGAPGGPGGAKR